MALYFLTIKKVSSKCVTSWVNCVDLIMDHGIVCLLYQEIELSWVCVFIVSGDRAILGLCVNCIRRAYMYIYNIYICVCVCAKGIGFRFVAVDDDIYSYNINIITKNA